MNNIKFVEEDFVVVRKTRDLRSQPTVTLAFGDAIEILEKEEDWTKIKVLTYFDGQFTGYVKGDLPVRDQGILKFSMVDVQQGDGMILETPDGKIILIDGGDNKLFARHCAARFRHKGTTADKPLEVDAMIITHGDADHFAGLSDIVYSEKLTGPKADKRLFIHPKRVYHNGLVKSPGKIGNKSIPDEKLFGATAEDEDSGDLLITDLYDDPRNAPAHRRNKPFKDWAESLDHWEKNREPIQARRVAFGMDEVELFDFLHEEGIKIEIQGPFATTVKDPDDSSKRIPALRFFHTPKKSAEMHLEQGDDDVGTPSASHTINGHSIAFRLSFGNVRFNFTGDLNQESMELMRKNLDFKNLEAEIVKVPHHGSHDFDFRTLQAMKPVVAIVSSGDESVLKEHIHPRATLMAALGKAMRADTGIVFCTELAAFFAVKEECHSREDLAAFFKKHEDRTFTGEELRKLFSGKPKEEDGPGLFYGFERKNFGIIHIRTDGERVLVFTHSGKKGLNEAYRFNVTLEAGERKIKFAPKVETR